VFISHGIDDAITPIAFARETHKLAQQNFPTLAMEYKVRPTLSTESSGWLLGDGDVPHLTCTCFSHTTRRTLTSRR
jgi:hypothetical protein